MNGTHIKRLTVACYDTIFISKKGWLIMSKAAVIYWSETGNTEAMAAAVADGAREKGAEIEMLTAFSFGADKRKIERK